MNSLMCITLIRRDDIYSGNPFPFIGKGIKLRMKSLKLQFSSDSTEASGLESMFSIPNSTIILLKVGSSRGLKISAS
ncbi:hypothetical protein Tco_0415363 [Tanacetum coccineum]